MQQEVIDKVKYLLVAIEELLGLDDLEIYAPDLDREGLIAVGRALELISVRSEEEVVLKALGDALSVWNGVGDLDQQTGVLWLYPSKQEGERSGYLGIDWGINGAWQVVFYCVGDEADGTLLDLGIDPQASPVAVAAAIYNVARRVVRDRLAPEKCPHCGKVI